MRVKGLFCVSENFKRLTHRALHTCTAEKRLRARNSYRDLVVRHKSLAGLLLTLVLPGAKMILVLLTRAPEMADGLKLHYGVTKAGAVRVEYIGSKPPRNLHQSPSTARFAIDIQWILWPAPAAALKYGSSEWANQVPG
ncbi:hypothetical protein B0H13DRAFT_1868037 [Mycena leptocephala]|nr:hypothetical protein B0H13DRAFT_1868037 [Mycena leptocephala]